MSRFIEVSKILYPRNDNDPDERYNDTDEPGEGAPATMPADGGEPSTPVLVNLDSIRCIYRRKDDRAGNPRVGCRITFIAGRGFAVKETYDILLGQISGDQPR